jgi:hypothetical protein
MPASPPAVVAVRFVIAGALAGAPILVAAQAGQAPGLPDPARLPSRPGLPGTGPGAGAPPRDASARRVPEKGTALVRGRVVALDTGLPLRRARVLLHAHGSGQPRVTMTDAEGTFALEQLPSGRYEVRGSKARYVDTALGARRPGGPGRPFDLAEGQTIDNVVLALPSAGVITGRVVDDAGDVVTGAMVTPMRFRTVNGERQLMPSGQMRSSDDNGTFRLFGLPPGKYYLSARADDFPRFGGEMSDPNPTGFAPTFFPGTAVASEAQPIEVVAGAEAVADLQLVTARLTTITGIVVNPAGAPATGGHMMISTGSANGSWFMSAGGGARIKPDGTFTLSGIAPGEYTIVAQASFGEASMFKSFDSDRQRSVSVPVVASGTPIAGLRLVAMDPIQIPVSVTAEDGGTERPGGVRVSAGAERGMGGGMAMIRDGRLSLEVVPGTYRLSASAGGDGPGATRWFVKRITYRGREIGDDTVALTAEPDGRIDVVLTTKSSTVTGDVSDSSGKPVTDYTVILFPEDTALLRRAAYQRVRVARADQQGRFRAEHLPPGDYLAAAIHDVEVDDIHDPDFLDGLRRAAKSFRLAHGSSATLALTLTPVP